MKKRLKEWWDKIKKRLIKKLGGYTEQIVYKPVQADLPRYMTTLKASVIVNLDRPGEKSAIDQDVIALCELRRKIVNSLIDNKLLAVRYCNDFQYMRREIEATLVVVPPFDHQEPEESYYYQDNVFKYWEHTRGGQHETAG